MADYQFNTNLGPAQQQGTSLGDLINTARGAQAFQQQQQLNPIQLEKAQEELSQAKIGTQSAQMKFGGEKMQKFMDTVGARATDQELLDAVQKKDIGKVKDLISGDIQDLITHKVFTPAEAMQAGARMLDLADKDINSVVPALKNLVTRAASPESRLQLQTPHLTTNAAGALVGANPVLNRVNVLGENQQGGGQGAGANQNSNPNFQVGSNPNVVSLGSTKEQATQAINNYIGSVNALTDASKPGHIPTQEFIAKKLLTYLKDPSVNTGPIADVLAGKSNQATLTSKEQEVLKLIQQRIQNLNPRTDADAQSKKDAYGSFRLKKDALNDLIRQDLGNIQNQKLLAHGMMNAAGDSRNPNLPAVNRFQSEYSQFSKDPILMQYMGIVGTGQKAAIDEHDKEALRKLMRENGLSSLTDIEQKRKQLVEISGVK